MKRILNTFGLSKWILLLLLLLTASLSLHGQLYVAGFQQAKEDVLRSIPVEYINKARTEFVVAYQHTSHGTHVSRGVFGLQDYKNGDDLLFGVSLSPVDGKLDFRDYAMESYAPSGVTAIDLSADETAFIQTTRNFLDASENADVNIIMWSWCSIAGHNVEGNYLPGMDSLISEYGPGGSKIGTGEGQRELSVSFIFMTGHANENANAGTLQPKPQSELINSYCNTNAQFCLDYYSIDSHDMDDNYWEDVGDNGNSSSYGGNFYEDWQNASVVGEDYYYNRSSPGGPISYGSHLSQHITANRKAYAFWWIMARIAGWDGGQGTIPVSEINVSSQGGVTTMLNGATLQFSAEVLPANATDNSVSWSVIDQTGSASISTEGFLTANSSGTVLVKATANDGSGVSDSFQLTIIEPVVLVSSIQVSSDGGVSEVLTGESLQMFAEILPVDAGNKDITWSVSNHTGSASITQAGLLTASSAGTVSVIATAQDGSEIAGNMQITITDAVYPVSSITVSSAGGVAEILTGENLQFTASILPANASNKDIAWSVSNQAGSASITQAGLLTASSAGTVTVTATAQDGSGVSGTYQLSISDPQVPVTSILVTNGALSLVTTGETLQLDLQVLPSNASDKSVLWSVEAISGSASITQSGLLTGISAGTVNVVATAQDGSGIEGSVEITVVDPDILITDITVSAAGDVTEMVIGESLQLSAEVSPQDATNQSLEWSVVNSTGEASISQSGQLTAVSAGTVSVLVRAQDGSEVEGSLEMTISDPDIPVSSIVVNSAGGVSTIEKGETLQFSATVLPANASNGEIVWSVDNESGSASISADGLLTALTSGTVTVIATAQDGSGVSSEMQISISDELIGIVYIEVQSEGEAIEAGVGSSLQFTATVFPANASNKEITWSVENHHGSASITQAGLLTGLTPGTVTVEAVARDGSDIKGSMIINITRTDIPVTSIQVRTVDNICSIITGGTLQFIAVIQPSNATNKDISWSLVEETGTADITPAGLLTATGSGTVQVTASTQDGSGFTVSKQVTITNPEVPVSSVTIVPENGITRIYTGNSLQLFAEILPEDASSKNVNWDVINDDGLGEVSAEGVFTGIEAGKVRVTARAVDGTGVSDTLGIVIEDSVIITSIEVSLEGGGVSVAEGDIVKCEVDIEPESASGQGVTWTVQNITGSASISYDGYLTALSMGVVGVIATPCSCFGMADTLEVEITSATALEQMEIDPQQMTLYPNPGMGSFFLDAGDIAVELIEFIDAGGNILKQIKPEISKGIISIEVNDFPAGYYFLRIHSGSARTYKKLIIY